MTDVLRLDDISGELGVECRPDADDLHVALYGAHQSLRWHYQFRLDRTNALVLADWIRTTFTPERTE